VELLRGLGGVARVGVTPDLEASGGRPAAVTAPVLVMIGYGRAKRDTAASITKSPGLSLAEATRKV